MKIKITSILFFAFFGILSGANAQDSTAAVHVETKKERKERKKLEDHPNAVTDEQRAQIKKAEEDAVYKRHMYAYDANLTPAQRRAKIAETKKEMITKIKTILTPEQLAKVTVRPSSHPQPIAVNYHSGNGRYDPREKRVLRTIEVAGDSVRVEFYDNGAVDGDSITVFYNNKMIVQHLMLTEKPAAFTIAIDKNNPKNEIVMYAENLGTEPPNTALLVVTEFVNGRPGRHYEVDVSSDLKRSGTIYLHPIANR